ncbi:MAG: DUF1990 domain-containing protein [Aureliella sp.]
MLLLSKPQPCAIRQFLSDQLTGSLSYPEVGATDVQLVDGKLNQAQLPKGYAINHRREILGHGQATFDAACNAVDRWEQLQLGWVSSWPVNAPLADEEVIAVIGRAFGMWWLNACRVVYTVDQRDTSTPKYGYAHGTLPDHLASGEERFLVEMDEHGTVTLDILAFSRPNSFLARLGYPHMRLAQKRFGRESVARMKSIVQVQHTDLAERPAARVAAGV